MRRNRDQLDVEVKLSVIASEAEELHALLFEEYPKQAEFWGKVAAQARKHGTCMRVHGALPEPKAGAPLVEAAKAATQIHRQLAGVSHLIPKRKDR